MASRTEHLIDDLLSGSVASGAYMEVDAGVPLAFPLVVVLWESGAKLKRVLDKTIARNANQSPAYITWRLYKTDGVTVQQTYVDAYTYDTTNTMRLASITRTIT